MDVTDLCLIEEPNNEIILKTLKDRFEAGCIYTYAGDILICINPYKDVNLFTDEVSKEYLLSSQAQPHIYGLSRQIYNSLIFNNESQCSIVSGETGSGKTTNNQQLFSQFLKLCLYENYKVFHKLKKVDIILSAFGNAKTSLNTNATRHGKYMEVLFAKNGKVIGGNVNEYLLEKSRISFQGEDEESFHIFFYLFSGRLELELSKHLLNAPSQHRYLQYGSAFCEDLIKWSQKYTELIEALDVFDFTKEEISNIFAVLSAILNIGDLKFKTDGKDESDSSVFIENNDALDKVSLLLGVESEELELPLTTNTVASNDDQASCFKNIVQANTCRDGLARNIYTRLFSWLVQKINQVVNPDDFKKRHAEFLSVGFLGMFGFEDINNNNSLEHLCINIANEQIQFHFTQNIFALEQNEFEEECLSFNSFKYADNKAVINLLLEKPHGVLAILDEESKSIQADDQTLLSSYNAHCSEKESFITSTESHTPLFTISHFAGKVSYSTEHFLEKNNDKVEEPLLECLRCSKNQLVSTLYNASVTRTGSLALRTSNLPTQFSFYQDYRPLYEKISKAREKNDKNYGTNKASRNMKSRKKKMIGTGRKIKAQLTTAALFRNSLVDLMEKILYCQAHFIRCVKASNIKEENLFDDECVAKQLKYLGITDTVLFRKNGYPVRLLFKTFLQRYRFIKFPLKSSIEETSDTCQQILDLCQIENTKAGPTKLFLKLEHVEKLTEELKKIIDKVIITQKMVRGHLARIDFDFLQTNRKQEERNIVVSISSKSNKMYDNIISLNDVDTKRNEKQVKGKELKKKEREKDIQQRKLTKTSSDPDANKTKETLRGVAADNTPNRKVPKVKSRIEPVMRNFTSSASSAWCRIDCYERQFHVASFQMDQAVLCVEGTHPFSDKNRIAFSSLPMRSEDPKVTKVKSCIGKGVQLHQDERQNLWATRLGKNPIFVRGHTLCPELVKLNGKLTQGVPMKVLDTIAFKEYMRKECETNGTLTQELKDKIISRLKVCMSFIKDTVVDEETPCWFEVWLLKYKDSIVRYLESYQKRRDHQEKRRSLHLAYTPSSADTPRARVNAPSIRRAKSGDQLKVERGERRPRSQTTLVTHTEENKTRIPKPRPLSKHLPSPNTDKSIEKPTPNMDKPLPNMEKALNRLKELQREEGNIPRKVNQDFRREKSMDIRLESRVLMEREYRNSMKRSLDDKSTKRVKKDSPSRSPEFALSRTASGGRKKEIRDSTMDSNNSSDNSNNGTINSNVQNSTTPIPVVGDSVDVKKYNTPKAGMSYRQVFGIQSSDYIFNVTPPNYTRHRRFSDSDTESLQNFVHRIIPQDDSRAKILQPKKWIKKVRRKSETEPKRKVIAQLSNK